MGTVLSRVKVLRIAVKQVLALSASYERLLKRIEADPGLPVPSPTKPFWHDIRSPLDSHTPEHLPEYADVVILGSGITGTSVAHTLLRGAGDKKLRVVMLEARGACSGATGRNGGHIKPPLHHDYSAMKKRFGREQAAKLIRFRLMHVHEIHLVAASEDILKESQCREVESIDVYFDPKMFEEAKAQLAAWKKDMPEESRNYFWLDGDKAIEKFHLSPDVVGVIYNQAGAVHPYRFVTHILARLLERHADSFCLATHTPCTAIQAPSAASSPHYAVITPRGTIRTPHVVHATNAWCSHLLPALRAKIFCVRGTMTAQRPGSALSPSTLDGRRSWVFYDKHLGYDYLTQLPTGERELMFGGGFFQGGDDGLDELGVSDDAVFNAGVAAHLAGSLPLLFGGWNWGAEAPLPPPDQKQPGEDDKDRWFDGRVKAAWSGIIGISADRVPWVGRLPPTLADRDAPSTTLSSIGMSTHQVEVKTPLPLYEKCESGSQIAAPGEWLCAGYSGEGMAHAFMSGRALALQVLGREAEAAAWLPECMGVSVERWKKARAEDLVEELWG